MQIDLNNTADQIYRQIYDGQIGVKQFQKWLILQLQKAYDRGVSDADAPPSYDDISRSQYN